MSKNVLITGGAGFVGRWFCKKFRELEWNVICVDNMISESSKIEGDVIEKDCRDYFKENTNKSFDLVIHLAAIVGGRNTIENSPIAVADDLSIDAAMFKWAIESKPSKIIYFSSSAAYPIAYQTEEKSMKLAESMISFKNDFIGIADLTYGWSKLTGEFLAKIAHDKYNLNIVCYRPFSGYGPDQDECYPFPGILARVIRKENPINIWSDTIRDFIYIEDVVNCVLTTYEKINDGSAINIGSGRPISFKMLAEKMCKIYQHNAEINILDNQCKGVYYRVADITYAESLGFISTTSLDDGIKKCIEFKKKIKKIAIYNGFAFHYELMGFVIDYCQKRGYDTTIYCGYTQSNGYCEFYIKHFDDYIKYKEINLFYLEHQEYDNVFLITDDDLNYSDFKHNQRLMNKTIVLDAWFELRNNYYLPNHRITNRPFVNSVKKWSLPVYQIDVPKNINNQINIIVLSVTNKYNTALMNNLSSSKEIIIHFIGRQIKLESFININQRVRGVLYENLNFLAIMELMKHMNFGITDICQDKESHEDKCLAGMIPLMISTLTPLIISKQTNLHYKIKSALEFDKKTNDTIYLDNYQYDVDKLKSDREYFIKHNYNTFSTLF